ncbi:hypothetical protein C2134_16910 [Chromobacterium sinusclupearum]|uniref:Uncharacterized protein n=1 Tax=Chromobacterium sinusclupearum TaxID=2077146 RepID=A0A2K4MKA7_9NEIS|nr:hypothetical protein [Chromobacterium sinusclupearum]POA97506.1 hypothetical protein C2134_16910 [Chromobacterium sinusclupearum]
MKRSAFHAISGSIAMLSIASFWTSTLVSELLFDHEAITLVKHAIAYTGIPILVLAMIMTGATGNLIGRERKGRLLDEKKKRMPIIAINGLLIMIPSALFLYHKASLGQFDRAFYLVQAIELSIGLIQLLLMGKNFRAGLRIAGRLRASAARI